MCCLSLTRTSGGAFDNSTSNTTARESVHACYKDQNTSVAPNANTSNSLHWRRPPLANRCGNHLENAHLPLESPHMPLVCLPPPMASLPHGLLYSSCAVELDTQGIQTLLRHQLQCSERAKGPSLSPILYNH